MPLIAVASEAYPHFLWFERSISPHKVHAVADCRDYVDWSNIVLSLPQRIEELSILCPGGRAELKVWTVHISNFYSSIRWVHQSYLNPIHQKFRLTLYLSIFWVELIFIDNKCGCWIDFCCSTSSTWPELNPAWAIVSYDFGVRLPSMMQIKNNSLYEGVLSEEFTLAWD